MFRRVNNNKFGVIEYAIDSEEDLLDLPREDTNNAVYAILRKDGKKLVYLYSKEIKDLKKKKVKKKKIFKIIKKKKKNEWKG